MAEAYKNAQPNNPLVSHEVERETAIVTTKTRQQVDAVIVSGIDAQGQTSGLLVIGLTYVILTYVAGDDFTNVGGTNATGNGFVATGTTPTAWANGSTLQVQPYSAIVPTGAEVLAPGVEVTPTGSVRVEHQETNSGLTNQIVSTTDYATYYRAMAMSIEVPLPHVLVDLELTFQGNTGAGSYPEPTAQTDGTSWSFNVTASATAVAAVVPTLIYRILAPEANNVQATQYEFLLPNPVSLAQIIAKLQAIIGGNPTINVWPNFHPVALNFLAFAEKFNIQVSANSAASQSDSGDYSYSYGNGYSNDYSPSLNQVDIPPTIHGSFSLSNTGNVQTGIAAADASFYSPLTGTITNAITEAATATAILTPTSVAATSPAAIPSSGLQLYKYSGRNYADDWMMYVCIVFDAATL